MALLRKDKWAFNNETYEKSIDERPPMLAKNGGIKNMEWPFELVNDGHVTLGDQ